VSHSELIMPTGHIFSSFCKVSELNIRYGPLYLKLYSAFGPRLSLPAIVDFLLIIAESTGMNSSYPSLFSSI
jgi:hypothetical protein